MPTVRGKADLQRFLAQLPSELEKKVLRGAVRAGGRIILDEAKDRSISSDVDEALVMRTKAEAGRITVKITIRKGWGRAIVDQQRTYDIDTGHSSSPSGSTLATIPERVTCALMKLCAAAIASAPLMSSAGRRNGCGRAPG